MDSGRLGTWVRVELWLAVVEILMGFVDLAWVVVECVLIVKLRSWLLHWSRVHVLRFSKIHSVHSLFLHITTNIDNQYGSTNQTTTQTSYNWENYYVYQV